MSEFLVENRILKSYNGSKDIVVVPDGVTTIGGGAFKGDTSFKRIVISEGVTVIKYNAFWGCERLNSVYLPKSLRVIEDNAFVECKKLKWITLPNGLMKIGGQAFSGSGLTDITIPKTLTDIGADAFSETPWQAHIQKKKQFVVVNDILVNAQAFTGRSLRVMSGLTKIASCADRNNDYLEELTIEEGVKSIGSFAFNNCRSLHSVHIPKSVTEIGFGAFSDTPWIDRKRNENPFVSVNNILIDANAAAIGSIEIPYGIKKIADSAFDYCQELTEVIVPESVTEICENAFQICSNLKKVEIRNGSATILDSAFGGCDQVQVLYNGKVYSPNSPREHRDWF